MTLTNYRAAVFTLASDDTGVVDWSVFGSLSIAVAKTMRRPIFENRFLETDVIFFVFDGLYSKKKPSKYLWTRLLQYTNLEHEAVMIF